MMAFRMNHNDYRILECIADYRILTPTQIAALHRKSRQVVWRRLRVLENEGFLKIIRCELGQSRGRPESLLGLAENGLGVLKERDLLSEDIVALMYISALSRSDLPREKRRPFHIYLDEAPKFVTDTLGGIIAEAPKHGVSLTLAHQFLRQFDTKKVDALGSVRTTIVFNVDSRDAGYLSKDFRNKANVNDFINLERGEAIVRCGTEIAKIKTLGPLEIPEKNFKERIIAESR